GRRAGRAGAAALREGELVSGCRRGGGVGAPAERVRGAGGHPCGREPSSCGGPAAAASATTRPDAHGGRALPADIRGLTPRPFGVSSGATRRRWGCRPDRG